MEGRDCTGVRGGMEVMTGASAAVTRNRIARLDRLMTDWRDKSSFLNTAPSLSHNSYYTKGLNKHTHTHTLISQKPVSHTHVPHKVAARC